MKIEWFGHSCFRINDSLVIDPFKAGSVPGYGTLDLAADKVICTHEHADHSGRECVKLSGAECALTVTEIASWHDDQQGALRGANTIFVVESDGEKLVHLGDLGHFPNEEQLAAISGGDYLLIPVGGHYTIDGVMAAKICEAAKPKTIIPMHYRWGEHGYSEISTLDGFLDAIKTTTLAENVAVLDLSE
ncbi:MAG: MBL fold metallo-hydrolase [Candidatus Saccharibacteria bacterium]|nr:MBL fold metallo-hydrolase [Candidatus Saccharibacteria bacterium]